MKDILVVSVQDPKEKENCAEIVRITESDPWPTKVSRRRSRPYKGHKVKFENRPESDSPTFALEPLGGNQPMQVRLQIQIGQCRLRACIDTGASRSLMSLGQWKTLATPGLQLKQSNVSLVACGSKPIKVHGSEQIPFRIEGNKQPYAWPFIIADSWSPHHDCILGVDFLVQVGARIDLLKREIIFQKELKNETEPVNTVNEDSRISIKTREEVTVAPYSGIWVSGIVEWADPNKPSWQGSGVYESAIDYGRGVTISEALVEVIQDQATVWAENRTPHEYLIPQGQVLGWLSEKDEVEDWILGEYKPLDLKKGLQISQVEGDGRLTCQGSDIHADLRTHEETLKKPPEVRSGPFIKGDRACVTEDVMKERTVVKRIEVQFKPDSDQGQGIHHISQYSAV